MQRPILGQLGYTFAAGEWQAPGSTAPSFVPSADAMHGMLMRCADALVGRKEGSDEQRELKAITNAIEAYEVVRFAQARFQISNIIQASSVRGDARAPVSE